MGDQLNLSIVVPAFNAELTIERALRSTFPLLDAGAKCVVINDGSVDSTAQVVTALQEERREIRLVDQANMGLSGARNRGVAEATGSWLTFLDADDELVPTGIRQAIDAATELHLAIGKSRIQRISPEETFLAEFSSRATNRDALDPYIRSTASWLLEAWGGLLGCVFSTHLIRQLSPPFASVPFGEDLIFVYTLATLQDEYAQTDHVGYRYVIGSGQQMTAPSNPLRLTISQAFEACESVARRSLPHEKALFWALVQRYRWSRSRQVSADLRQAYREEVMTYAKGLRSRLSLSRRELAGELLALSRTQRKGTKSRLHRRP